MNTKWPEQWEEFNILDGPNQETLNLALEHKNDLQYLGSHEPIRFTVSNKNLNIELLILRDLMINSIKKTSDSDTVLIEGCCGKNNSSKPGIAATYYMFAAKYNTKRCNGKIIFKHPEVI